MANAADDNVYRVTREEIRSFVERIEQLNLEKNEIADQQKEVFSEAKSSGAPISFDCAVTISSHLRL